MNLREHVMETVAAVEVTVPAGDLLELLDERDALVLQLYFVEELNLEEIGEVLGVTVGRVSQLKKAALGKLREWMSEG